MLQFDRRVEVGGVSRSSRSLNTPELKVQLIDNVGVGFDTRPVAEALGLSLSARTLTIVLDGVYETEREVGEKGTVLLESRDGWRERWSGERQRFLTLVLAGDGVIGGVERIA